MELIRYIVKQVYQVLILCVCVLFAVRIFFAYGEEEQKDVFENAGTIFAPMIGSDELKENGMESVTSIAEGYVPALKYNSGAKNVGDCVCFKELFLVQKQDGSYVNGSTENDFALYLEDIKNKNGYSVLERLLSNEIAELEEIPAPFIYDKEQDLLYIYGSGTYIVQIKVYGSSGSMQMYEFTLPVESL